MTHPLDAWLTDADTGEYWRLLQDGTVCAGRCDRCGRWQTYRRRVCHGCGAVATARWHLVGPQGEVYSIVLQHRAPAGFDLTPPYQVALVVLDDGPTVLAAVDPQHRLEIGDQVSIGVREVAGTGRLPVVRPAVTDVPPGRGGPEQ